MAKKRKTAKKSTKSSKGLGRDPLSGNSSFLNEDIGRGIEEGLSIGAGGGKRPKKGKGDPYSF